jgi:ribonuclease HI
VYWLAPPQYVVKLNIDSNSLGNPGGILRNSGECLLSFFGRCGYATNTNAELLAIAHGLNTVWNAGFKTVICESDSQTAPQLITKDVLETHPYATMLKHIKEFLSFDWCMSFTHTV